MCIDYTDLNKAIPKKPFPLPWIDQVVDAIAGLAVLYFLDAYKGYHQIQVAIEDMEKITFVTDDGLFATRMPFGLKNSVVEFQQMVNKLSENK